MKVNVRPATRDFAKAKHRAAAHEQPRRWFQARELFYIAPSPFRVIAIVGGDAGRGQFAAVAHSNRSSVQHCPAAPLGEKKLVLEGVVNCSRTYVSVLHISH